MSLEGKQFSHYRLLRIIGRGGMGEVYLAEDIQIGRQVAVKTVTIEAIQPDDEAVATALRLFLREATAIASLDHPNILPLYDYGEIYLDGSHIAYLIVPYRPEGSLITWLRKLAREQQTQQLTLKQVAHVIQQAGQALQYAHDHQVLHLDVKPANFLIRSTSATDVYPDLLLSDFGIARLASAASSASQQVRGTPTYMAPEQWAGQPTFASDQYALAIMAYELLTGSPPFQGPPLNVMLSHMQEPPKPARDSNSLLPPAVDLVLGRALVKQPQERFPSVAAFSQAFREAFQGVNEATTLRVLHPSPAIPTPQLPQTSSPSSAGDVHTTLALSTQEARSGVVRTLLLASGRAVSVPIPPGAQFSQVLVLNGQGEVPGPDIPAGNLYITLKEYSVLCQRCQAVIPSETGSCPRCGQPVVQPVPTIPFQQPAVSPPPPTGQPVLLPLASTPVVQPQRRRKGGCGVAAIILLIVLLGGGALYGGLYYYGHVGRYQQIYRQATSGQPTYAFSLTNQQSPWSVAQTADGICSYGSDGYQVVVNPDALHDSFTCLDTQHHYSSGRTLAFQVQMRIHTNGGMGGITLVDCDSMGGDQVYAIDPVSDYKFGFFPEDHAFARSSGPQSASFNESNLLLYDNGDSTSSTVHMGSDQLNQLTAVMQEDTLYMYINQQYIWAIALLPTTTCTLGLVAIDPASSVSFTNVQIWSK